LTAISGMMLLRHARQQGSNGWAIAAGASTGFGVWATHFVAMLGYTPGLEMSYLPGLTLASLLVAVLGVTAGMAIARFRRRPLAMRRRPWSSAAALRRCITSAPPRWICPRGWSGIP
jgi:NO-binding membrane sensor protein with MHYT domain